MATFGSFADLTPANIELAQRRQATGGDVLNNLIRGLTQGVEVAQLPGQLQQQALTNQLKAQLAQQQLQDLQNPEEALARRIRESIALQQAKPIEVGNSLLQYDPVSKQYKAVYTAPRTASQSQIRFDPNTGRQLVEVNGQLVARQIPLEETIGRTQTPILTAPQADFDPTLFSGNPAVTLSEELVTPSAPTVLGGTIDERAKIAEQVKKDEQKFRTDLQEDAQKFTDEQRRLSERYLKGKEESKPAKLPSAKIQDQYMGAQNLFKTAPRLKQKIDELRKKGIAEPTSFEKTVINAAYQDPKGLFSGFVTAVATGQIRPEIADLEQLRAEIESNYTTSKAGLSQTASEIKRTIPVAPTRFDSWDRMLSKTENLEEIAGIYTKNVNSQYPGFAKESGISTEINAPSRISVGTIVNQGGKRYQFDGQNYIEIK